MEIFKVAFLRCFSSFFLHNSCAKSKIRKNCFMSRWAVECAFIRWHDDTFWVLSATTSWVALRLFVQHFPLDKKALLRQASVMFAFLSQGKWWKNSNQQFLKKKYLDEVPFHPHSRWFSIKVSKFWYEWINCMFYDVFTTYSIRYTQSTSIFTRFDMHFPLVLFLPLDQREKEEKFVP